MRSPSWLPGLIQWEKSDYPGKLFWRDGPSKKPKKKTPVKPGVVVQEEAAQAGTVDLVAAAVMTVAVLDDKPLRGGTLAPPLLIIYR
jgi:hypothetical protein